MRERIAAALKDAMRSKDQTRLCTLRLMMAAIKDREIAAREEPAGEVDQKREILDVLSKMIKQRQESLRAYEEAGRLELAAREQTEIEVIREFMPRPLKPEEVDAAVADAIGEINADSIKDMGRVMALLKERHQGRMDFEKVGPRVKKALL